MIFVPANLSCFFTIHPHPDPRWAGTCGLGFTVNAGVQLQIHENNSKTVRITYNGQDCMIEPVREICQMYRRDGLHISITSPFPLGGGFGMSGASSLATAYALNPSHKIHTNATASPSSPGRNTAMIDFLETNKKAAIIAHTAEARCSTGLGDVINQYYQGVLLKKKPSSWFEATRISVDQHEIWYRIFGTKDTSSTLQTIQKDHLNNLGTKAIEQIIQEKKNNPVVRLNRILEVSRKFCTETGLLTDPETSKIISDIEKRGGSASLILIGKAVMSSIPFPKSKRLQIQHEH